MLSRYLADEPNFVERLLFNLPKQPIAAQQASHIHFSEETAPKSEHTSGIEGLSDDLMEELNAIVMETSRQEK
jgi:hypothetical protein